MIDRIKRTYAGFGCSFVCGLLFAASIWIVTPLRTEALGMDVKPPLVVSGYIMKIDLKKKELTVRGTVFTPGAQFQDFLESSSQGRGGGRGGSGGRRAAGTPDEPLRDFSIYVRSETVIQKDNIKLTLDDLRVQDYVVVIGTAKGSSINATSISLSNPQDEK